MDLVVLFIFCALLMFCVVAMFITRDCTRSLLRRFQAAWPRVFGLAWCLAVATFAASIGFTVYVFDNGGAGLPGVLWLVALPIAMLVGAMVLGIVIALLQIRPGLLGGGTRPWTAETKRTVMVYAVIVSTLLVGIAAWFSFVGRGL